MKKTTALILLFSLIISVGCKAEPNEKHTIPYPDGYATNDGAAAYEGLGEHFDSPYFMHPDFYNMKNTDTFTILPNFKTYQQTTGFHCGPASALMVLEHYGESGFDELSIGEAMNTGVLFGDEVDPDLTEIGTTVENFKAFFEQIGYNTTSSLSGQSPFDEEDPYKFREWVIENLKNNTPIMVEWVDWGGHWTVIIGYDTMGTEHFGDDVIIFADPFDTSDHWQDGYTIVNAERFFYMWFDTIHQPQGQQLRQWVIAQP